MATKNLPAVRLVDRDEVPELPELSDELRLAFAELAGAAREGLLAMSVSVGLRVLVEMMEEELTAKVGPKHAKIPGRTATRHASAPGSVVLGARRVKVRRPRARTTEGTEVHLDTYAPLRRRRRVVGGGHGADAGRPRHPPPRAAGEPVGAELEATARSTSKSSVSRRFVAKTKKALEELMSRDLSDLDVVALMLDGVKVAEHCAVVALAICADGTKVPVGLWLGDTENKTVVTALLPTRQLVGVLRRQRVLGDRADGPVHLEKHQKRGRWFGRRVLFGSPTRLGLVRLAGTVSAPRPNR